MKVHLGTTPVDKEKLKLIMERMCREAGVILKYRYLFVGAETEGRFIRACTFATNNGFYRIEAKSVIDCTGDAAVCYRAGGECYFSDETGALQPVSTFFLIDGVDKERLDDLLLSTTDERARAFMDLLAEERAEHGFPCGTVKVRLYEQPGGIWSVNMCQIDHPFDVNDPDCLTEAEIEGREQAHAIFDFLVRRVPGLEHARLLQTSDRVGVRESRRIAGEYLLTYEDLCASRMFEDAVVVLSNSVDVHTSGAVNYRAFANPAPYSIPYRSLVHRDFDNLWSAGKTVSADRLAHGAVRVMPPCVAMGQAAGIAAAMSAKDGTPAREIAAAALREQLKQEGAYL